MQNSIYQTATNRLNWVREMLVQWRVWILGILWLSYVLIELIEHRVEDTNPFLVYLAEFILLVSLPLVGLILVDELLRNIKARNQTAKLLELKQKLNTSLATSADYYGLSEGLLLFASNIVPYTRAELLVYDPMTSRYETLSERGPSPYGRAQSTSIFLSPEAFHTCPVDHTRTVHPICTNGYAGQSQAENPLAYCLPLTYGDEPVAQLHFFLPQEQDLTAEQADLLNSLGTDLAMALVTAQQRQERASLAIDKATLEERRLISRDLHDTLGQNLSYLRLQLDQFTRQDSQLDAQTFRAELEQMLEITTESYELVRGTLAILHNEGTLPLMNLLMEHGRIIADRANFKIEFSQRGQPCTLRPDLTRQVYYIFSEALRNVEKHAQAQQVEVKMLWGKQDLTLQVSDDGRGFEPSAINATQHFGLKIMQDRTEAYGGEFSLRTAPAQGTQITIYIPEASLPDSDSQSNQKVEENPTPQER